MKKLLVLIGFAFCMIVANAQFPFARHYWINPNSYNHTLYPTSDGGYVLALVRHSRNAERPFKNSIAVLKLDASYNIQNQRVIWLAIGSGDDAVIDEYVNFEVHDIIESDNSGGYYVICGSVCHVGESPKGMVAVVGLGLNIQNIREYEEVETFYSVYAIDQYYYVCGNRQDGRGIVMRDEVSTMNPIAYVTNESWTYHRVRAKNLGRDRFCVSGFNGGEIGFTAFDFSGGNFVPDVFGAQDESWKFSHQTNPGSRILVTNYPKNAFGLMLSVSHGNTIYNYLFDNFHTLGVAFEIQYSNYDDILLQDVNCSQGKFAWVGNYPNQTAFYASMNVPLGIIYPPFPPTPVLFVNFSPNYSLHKVHFSGHYPPGDFHCGGFYQHHNGDRTTFVVCPEQIPPDDIHCGVRKNENAYNIPLPNPPSQFLQPLPVSFIHLNGAEIKWMQTGYDYCITDCENGILDQYPDDNSK